jgi:hypothetical protein
MIEAKLIQAKKSQNVSALKSKRAIETTRIEGAEDLKDKLNDVTDAQVKKTGTITIPTALFIDRSGSMEKAIEVGKNVAALISGATQASLTVVAFNDAPMEIVAPEKTYTAWDKAFRGVTACNGTSIGCALEYLKRKNIAVEQIIVITDEGENANPFFHNSYKSYADQIKFKPHVVLIRVNSSCSDFRDNLTKAQIAFDTYTPEGNDYYGLPGLMAMLSKNSKLNLIMEIMDHPLAIRKPYKI